MRCCILGASFGTRLQYFVQLVERNTKGMIEEHFPRKMKRCSPRIVISVSFLVSLDITCRIQLYPPPLSQPSPTANGRVNVYLRVFCFSIDDVTASISKFPRQDIQQFHTISSLLGRKNLDGGKWSTSRDSNGVQFSTSFCQNARSIFCFGKSITCGAVRPVSWIARSFI